MIALVMKVRNESHILQKTLDRWADYADEAFVYDDYSTDGTAEIAHEHPLVKEVISSSLLDPDRLRAEWYNRNLILQSALRFKPDWTIYADADEWIYNFDADILKEDISFVSCDLYDVHITPEDVEAPPEERQWVDPIPRTIPFFFRHPVGFSKPDQRIMDHKGNHGYCNGKIKHYGKGWSVEQWERKCEYYAGEFGHPAYAPKWDARRGKAVKTDYKSDTGQPLVRWETVCQL